MFRVGQKVVCVDSKNWEHKLTNGHIYTLVSINNEWLRLAEVPPISEGFRSFRFRPVVDRKTDIGVFQAMLKPAERLADPLELASRFQAEKQKIGRPSGLPFPSKVGFKTAVPSSLVTSAHGGGAA